MKCKKCNSELIEYRTGDSVEYMCPVCDESPAPQVENLIEFDPNKYVVRIVPVKTYEKSVLKGVARLCMCNTLEAKRILEENGFEFKPMDALDTKSLKRKIEDVGCEYTISPEFRW